MLLDFKYPPSEPCSCRICRGYCRRPGWWTVREAEQVLYTRHAFRMMLEVSPERHFGVLSPSFRGNEGNYSLEIYSDNGCTFYNNQLCELYGTGLQPLECRFCHHDRTGQGIRCHHDIETEWNTRYAQKLIVRWGVRTGFWQKQGLILLEHPH